MTEASQKLAYKNPSVLCFYGPLFRRCLRKRPQFPELRVQMRGQIKLVLDRSGSRIFEYQEEMVVIM